MGQPLSMDLRWRVLAAIDAGMSCRAAAVRFGVAPSTTIRWHEQRRETGSFAPKPQGGDRPENSSKTMSFQQASHGMAVDGHVARVDV